MHMLCLVIPLELCILKGAPVKVQNILDTNMKKPQGINNFLQVKHSNTRIDHAPNDECSHNRLLRWQVTNAG